MLTEKDVENSILTMDKDYEANFGDWIRNEQNSETVGVCLRNHMEGHSIEDAKVVIKWITKNWTLNSIIFLFIGLLNEPFQHNIKLSVKKMVISQRIALEWNVEFICVFLIQIYENLSLTSLKERFLANFIFGISEDLFNKIKEELIRKGFSKKKVRLLEKEWKSQKKGQKRMFD